jgi:SAM-dependent methyltransferase
MFQNAEAYESVMGRWSRRLSPQLIQFGGLRDGDRVLDVGCGTGSLSFALPERANISAVVGVDRAQAYVEFARTRNDDPRITFRQADACSLPFEEKSFDKAFSMLVLHFIPDSAKAVGEMRRVVRPGGMITAAVWDEYGGLPHYRMLVDVAATLDPSVERRLFLPLTAPDEMATLWRDLGLLDVEQTSLLIRMEFSCFDDYWQPFTTGEGPPGRLIASVSESKRVALQDQMRRAYIANRPDGPRSFACVAWACRGTVPHSGAVCSSCRAG